MYESTAHLRISAEVEKDYWNIPLITEKLERTYTRLHLSQYHESEQSGFPIQHRNVEVPGNIQVGYGR